MQLPLEKEDGMVTAIMSCNVAGLYTRTNKQKVAMLQEMADSSQAIFVAITESHLHNGILDAEVNMRGYSLIRADRLAGKRKGGVALYVRDDVARHLVVLTTGSTSSVEYAVVHIPKLNFVLAVVYRPPRLSNYRVHRSATNLGRKD